MKATKAIFNHAKNELSSGKTNLCDNHFKNVPTSDWYIEVVKPDKNSDCKECLKKKNRGEK